MFWFCSYCSRVLLIILPRKTEGYEKYFDTILTIGKNLENGLIVMQHLQTEKDEKFHGIYFESFERPSCGPLFQPLQYKRKIPEDERRVIDHLGHENYYFLKQKIHTYIELSYCNICLEFD